MASKAPIYTDEIKAARMTATRDAVASGFLEIQAATDAVLARFPLSSTGGTVASATWTMRFDAELAASTKSAIAGDPTDATKARVINSSSASRITNLTVGTSSSHGVQIDNISIATGQQITISAATLTHAVDPV